MAKLISLVLNYASSGTFLFKVNHAETEESLGSSLTSTQRVEEAVSPLNIGCGLWQKSDVFHIHITRLGQSSAP